MVRIFGWAGAIAAVALCAVLMLGGCENPANSNRIQGIIDGGVLTDLRDGQNYRTVIIGGKRWMAENLNYETDSGWCYENSSDSCAKYGRLYAWAAAIDACPAGWRLPDTADWNGLARAAGGRRMEAVDDDDGYVYYYWDLPVPRLKSKVGWYDAANGTDQFGFSALPGGVRGNFYVKLEDVYVLLYWYVGMYGIWWSATEDGLDVDVAHYRYMYYESDGVGEDYVDKSTGFSVRCVWDGL